MVQDFSNDRRLLDCGDDPHFGATDLADFHVNVEDPLEEFSPYDFAFAWGFSVGSVGRVLFGLRFGNNLASKLVVGAKYAVESGEMNFRSRHQGGQFFDQLKWLYDGMGGAVGERFFEAIDHLSLRVDLKSVECDRRPCNVTSDALKPLTIRSTDCDTGVERESRDIGDEPFEGAMVFVRNGVQGNGFFPFVGSGCETVVSGAGLKQMSAIQHFLLITLYVLFAPRIRVRVSPRALRDYFP